MNHPTAGERRFGPEGQTQIVFTAEGNVMLQTPIVDGAAGDVMSPTEKAEKAEKAEHKALQNNSYREVSAGGVTLTFRDFVYSHIGEPAYGHSLVKIVHSIVHETPDEEAAEQSLNQLKSVLAAAHRRVHEIGGNDHRAFRGCVILLAKRLGRPPCRNEIRKELGWDTKKVTEFCNANWLSWLTTGKPGRPKKIVAERKFS